MERGQGDRTHTLARRTGHARIELAPWRVASRSRKRAATASALGACGARSVFDRDALVLVTGRRAFRIHVEREGVPDFIGPEAEHRLADALVVGLDVAEDAHALQEELVCRVALRGDADLHVGWSVRS